MKIKNCRSCDSKDLTPIFSLGRQYISSFIKSKKEQGEKIPLNLVLCKKCKLLQLEHNAPDELMWNENYGYQSSISSTIKADLKDIVNKAKALKELERNDIVIDIGTNDGFLLECYDKGILVGFEPSKNVADIAKKKGFKIINNFFNAKDFKKEFKEKAKIITAISMFYDLENPNEFLKDITKCLDKDGIFIIQQNYLLDMLNYNNFDNVVHEHREYYSLTSLIPLLKRHGLKIFDIELNEINGGSLRTYVRFKGSKLEGFKGAKERIKQIKEKEKEMKLGTLKPYKEFAERIEKIKKDMLDFIHKEKKKGKKICGRGASTRGNTILQFFNLDSKLIDCIFDANPKKWGKKTIGSMIPIKSPDEVKNVNPDYQIIFIWHLASEIIKDEKEFLNKGGKFILPLPEFKII